MNSAAIWPHSPLDETEPEDFDLALELIEKGIEGLVESLQRDHL